MTARRTNLDQLPGACTTCTPVALLVCGIVLFSAGSAFAGRGSKASDLPSLYPRPIVTLPAVEAVRGEIDSRVVGLEPARQRAMITGTAGMKHGAVVGGRLPKLTLQRPAPPSAKPVLVLPEPAPGPALPKLIVPGVNETFLAK